MIIENARLSFKLKPPSGVDPETGFRTPGRSEWSNPIPCQMIPTGGDLRAVSNGEKVSTSRYTIYIEQGEEPIPTSEIVRLTALDGSEIGEFSLQMRPQLLESVCQIKLTI